MRIEIHIGGSQLTCVEVVEAIKRSRLNANDNSPFTHGETGIIHDAKGNNIGGWETTETDFGDD